MSFPLKIFHYIGGSGPVCVPFYAKPRHKLCSRMSPCENAKRFLLMISRFWGKGVGGSGVVLLSSTSLDIAGKNPASEISLKTSIPGKQKKSAVLRKHI